MIIRPLVSSEAMVGPVKKMHSMSALQNGAQGFQGLHIYAEALQIFSKKAAKKRGSILKRERKEAF